MPPAPSSSSTLYLDGCMGRVKGARSMAERSAAVKERPGGHAILDRGGASMPIGARGRHMGLDVGDRRIGGALSDETATLASALTTVTRKGGGKDAAALADPPRLPQAAPVAPGRPLTMDGTRGPA